MRDTKDLRIKDVKEILTPEALMADLPITYQAAETVHNARQEIYDVMTGEDDRLVVIIGPCSIHDTDAAIEYANLNLAANLTNIPLRIGLGWIMSKTTTENSYDLKCLFVN